jgi:hypothetical protein
MSRHTSRLGTLLRVRRIQEEISRGRLTAETAAERRTRGTLEQATTRYAAPAAGPLTEPEGSHVFVAHQLHRGALAGSVRAAVAVVDAAAEVTLLARHDWSAAAIRMAALERLDDRAREEARREQLCAEQRTSEESSSAGLLLRDPATNAREKRP